MSQAWSLGEVFVLRHAGFPFDWLEQLGSSDSTRAALDAVLAAEDRLLALGAEAPALFKGTPPRPPRRRPEDWGEAVAAWERARAALETEWTADRARLREALHSRCAEEEVQGAVFLSNPSIYENSFRRYAQESLRPENADSRRLDRQAYTYLQRLCGKNETTSYFGPMGYGEVLPDDRVSVEVAPSGDGRRRTFLAIWALTELARVIQRERVFRPELTLRQNPMFEVSATEVRCAPLGLEAPLSTLGARLVGLLGSGPQTVRALATQLGLTPGDLEREALPLLKVAFVLRGLPFATNDLDTLESLIAAVEAFPPSAERTLWLERLGTFAALLGRFAVGTLAQRRALLAELEALFTALTGRPARRGEGGVYEDRLILYEEAASPFALRFGKSFAERLARALGPGLELSAGYGEQIQRGHRQEVTRLLGPEGELDFLSYTVRTRPAEVSGTRFSPVPPLAVEDTGPTLQLDPGIAPPAGDGARFALPDVCLCGPLPAPGAPADGMEILLARVHHHLLVYGWLAAFHPRPERFRRVSARFVGGEPGAAGLTALAVRRRNKGFYAFPGRSLLQSVTDTNDFPAQALSPTQARVRLTPQGPSLHGPDGQPLQLYFPLDDFSKFAPFAALGAPSVVHAPLQAAGGHTPRVSVGGAVYQRRRWQVPTQGLAGTTGVELALGVQRLRRRLGLPRFVYGRTPAERKPYLFDLQSPFALELLRHALAGVEMITLEEMLPSPDQLFLRDGRGRYTFELRMQAERWTVTPPPER